MPERAGRIGAPFAWPAVATLTACVLHSSRTPRYSLYPRAHHSLAGWQPERTDWSVPLNYTVARRVCQHFSAENAGNAATSARAGGQPRRCGCPVGAAAVHWRICPLQPSIVPAVAESTSLAMPLRRLSSAALPAGPDWLPNARPGRPSRRTATPGQLSPAPKCASGSSSAPPVPYTGLDTSSSNVTCAFKCILRSSREPTPTT